MAAATRINARLEQSKVLNCGACLEFVVRLPALVILEPVLEVHEHARAVVGEAQVRCTAIEEKRARRSQSGTRSRIEISYIET